MTYDLFADAILFPVCCIILGFITVHAFSNHE